MVNIINFNIAHHGINNDLQYGTTLYFLSAIWYEMEMVRIAFFYSTKWLLNEITFIHCSRTVRTITVS